MEFGGVLTWLTVVLGSQMVGKYWLAGGSIGGCPYG